MIPAGFAYHRPASLDEAVALLARHGEAARVILEQWMAQRGTCQNDSLK